MAYTHNPQPGMPHRHWLFVTISLCIACSNHCLSSSVLDDHLPDDDFVMLGDINLGALVRITWPENGIACGTSVARPGIQVAAGIRYAIEKVNNNPDILGDIRLGVVILNDCDRASVALARSAKFLPLTQCYRSSCGNSGTYKVVGVMGPYNSEMSKPVAGYLGLFGLPVMSWSASSTEFSTSDSFKYFARTVPSDEHTIEAMVQLLVKFNWNYVSVLYVRSSRETVHMFKEQIKKSTTTICIAYEKQLSTDPGEKECNATITAMLETKARVVVVFLSGSTTVALLLALEKTGDASKFVFIAGDGFQPSLAKKVHSVLPLKVFVFYGRSVDPDFERYYRKLNPLRLTNQSTWDGELTPEDLNCTITGEPGKENCSRFQTMNDISDYSMYNGIGRVLAMVETYARALHNLIQDICPDKTNRDLRECINGPTLFKYITNTSFTSNGKHIHYEDNGDIFGDYVGTFLSGPDESYDKKLGKNPSETASYKHKYTEADAIVWDREAKNLTINWDLLPWDNIDEVNTSICSEPCKAGYRKIIKDLECCWDCERCQPNQILVISTCSSSKVTCTNGELCESCPANSWPDPQFVQCIEIEKTNMFTSALALACILIICAVLGIIKVVIILGLFIRHWERRAIKGCTRELMVPIMIGLTMAYITVFTFVYPPNNVICYVSYIGFNLSLSLLFGPLFLKTKRVHMIFQASDEYRQRVRNADSKSMVIGIIIIIAIQIILMVGTMVTSVLFPESAISEAPYMPMWNVKEVESRCHLEPWVLLVPLCYNILLLLLCAIYGFLTRKLPDNYNESWYIFIAVTTTIFVWIACIPTYFVVREAKYQVSLLSMALIINAVVICVCLFFPKIYVVYTIPERDIRISRLGSRRLSIALDEVNGAMPSSNQSFHRTQSTQSSR